MVPNPFRDRPYVWVTAGSLDDTEPLEIAVHICTNSQAPWDTIAPGAQQFDDLPSYRSLSTSPRPRLSRAAKGAVSHVSLYFGVFVAPNRPLETAAESGHSFLSFTAGVALLYRRAWDVSVGAVNATVARLGLEHGMAGLAFIEPLACIRRHGLPLPVAAFRAGKRRFGDHGFRHIDPFEQLGCRLFDDKNDERPQWHPDRCLEHDLASQSHRHISWQISIVIVDNS